jgi:cellulose biosynthesis protein BcsQ
MPVIALVSPRSTGKSTNSAWLAHALHERPEIEGLVVGFDADESHQLTTWYGLNKWAFPVHGAASNMAWRSIPSAMLADAYGVVDVGHLENHRDIGYAVLRIADLVLINCAPTLSDIERLKSLPMLGVLDDVAPLRPDGERPEAWVLLTRCQSGTLATGEMREELEHLGFNVLTTTIPARQMYAQTGGGMDIKAAGSAHDELLTELLKRGLI